MAGVRISGIPKNAEEKLIKIHFSKPQNGGGVIKKIYYPLFNNEAVVIYHDPAVVDRLLQNEHARVLGRSGGHTLHIQRLPEHSVFSSMQARVNPDASVLLQASPTLLDEFRYNEEIDVDFDKDTHTYLLSGNWYQLEWAWTYLDTFIQQQEVIQDEIKHQPFRNNASPMDVEDGGEGESGSTASPVVQDVGEKDRKRHAFYTENVSSDRTNRDRVTVAQSLSARHEGTIERAPAVSDMIHRTVRQAPVSSFERVLSPASSTDGNDDLFELTGEGYKIPDESIPVSMNTLTIGRKSDEENTFSQFSGLGLDRDRVKQPDESKAFEKKKFYSGSLKQGHIEQYSPDVEDNTLQISLHKQHPLSSKTDPPHSEISYASKGAEHTPLSETYTKDHMRFRFCVRGINVVVLYGDLVLETTDAIVNPANTSLEHWGGASAAISRAAGSSLDIECKDYIRKNGNLKMSEVVHTTGGKLNVSHVLHTNGPIWWEGAQKDKVEYELTCTFLNCFNYAETIRIKSLSVPAISTGVFGVPLDICIRSFLDALLMFGNDRKTSNLQNVRLINKDPDATVTAIVLLQTALEGDMEALASQAFEAYNRFKEKELHLPRGRQEGMGLYDTGLKSSSISLYLRSTSEIPASGTTKMTHRRSSSLSRLNTSTDNIRQEESTPNKCTKNTSSFPGSSNIQDQKTRSNSVSNGLVKTTNSGSSYLHKHLSSVGTKYKPDKDKMTITTPSLKKSLITTSSFSDKLKGVKKQGNPDSPTGKVRARRGYDDDDYGRTDAFKSSIGRDEPEFDLYSLPINLEGNRRGIHSRKSEEDEKCTICLDGFRRPKTLETCKHTFCSACIDEYFRTSKPSCPICGTIYGKIRGTQPRDGTMAHMVKHNVIIPGYEKADGSIVIKYRFPSGLQKAHHPNPGKMYKGIQRTAYLPNNREGQQVLGLLKKAFDARLLFTIGESRTTGKEDVLTWNDIHHKTNIFGGPENFGYPDPTYLTRVKQELADKGITSV